MYVKVLLELKNKKTDQAYTYYVNDALKEDIQIGKRVKVPFNKRMLEGYVLEINVQVPSTDDYTILEIQEVVDDEIILTKELLDIAYYIKETTLCSLSSAISVMLPRALKASVKTNVNKKYQDYLKLNGSLEECLDRCKNITQREIVSLVGENAVTLKKEAELISKSGVQTLLKNQVLEIEKQEEYRLTSSEVVQEEDYVLSPDQLKVVETIEQKLNEHQKYLLYGVTGSGKTEVYMQIIKEVIHQDKSVIVLVPEISLTPQFIENFKKRFASLVACLHSGLSDGEKYDEWRKINRGEAKIVIGARSAIFAPLKNLGLIIIDEEHSETYKQENSPRYNAIDVAIFRTEKLNIPLILGSATPSLEHMARASKNLFTLLKLPTRINNQTLPNCAIVDMAKEMKKGNYLLSDRLKVEIESAVSRGEQVILLLNRRGFATNITCSNCGYTYKCPNCEITLTYHKTKNVLRCHYCGYTIFKKDNCPNCGEDLNMYGSGTEKLEEVIKKEYPDLRVIRMDADTTKHKNGHAEIIEKFKNYEYDILLGTQMISKGLDFERVSLVGIINADASLNMPDFRSGERTFSLLLQASGRAGRKDTIGNVVIQTFNPDSFILKCVADQDYDAFYNYEMNIRKKLKYPPYYYLVGIKIQSRDYNEASHEATKVASYLRKNLSEKTIILGPTIANMFKVNNIYHFQIIIKYRFDDKLKKTLQELDKMYIINNKVKLDIDINPVTV